DLVLCLFELGLEILLRRLIAGVGFLLDIVDQLEGSRRGAAAAQADEIIAAGQRVDRVGDEIAVVRDRNDDGLAEEILALLPEAVLENVRVADDDHLDRLLRGLHLRRARRRLVFAGVGGIGSRLIALASVLGVLVVGRLLLILG